MSDSEDSKVTYTIVSSPYEGRFGDVSPGVVRPPALPPPDYVPGPEEPEQAPPSPEDDVFPAEEQPLPAAASPTAESPGYILEADRPEVTLTPQKRLSIVHYPRYEAGESSVAAAARPIEGRR
nr:hypothetical protein [Tanacetum cinerariifolium]